MTGSPTSGKDSSDLPQASENLQLMAARKNRSFSSVGSIKQFTSRHRVSLIEGFSLYQEIPRTFLSIVY